MTAPSLPCIVCAKELENVFEGAQNQPDGGVAFTSPGTYGSTVFDPVGTGHRLEINICDDCLGRAGRMGRVYTYNVARPVVTRNKRILVGWVPADHLTYESWDADLYLMRDEIPYDEVGDRHVHYNMSSEELAKIIEYD